MFKEKLDACRTWFYDVQISYADKLDISIELDDSTGFVGNIDSPLYLGQLCISQPDFRPYTFVEFTILDIHQNVNQVPAFWYGDGPDDTIQDIIKNLNNGLQFLLRES